MVAKTNCDSSTLSVRRKKAGRGGQRLLAEQATPPCHKAETDKGAEGTKTRERQSRGSTRSGQKRQGRPGGSGAPAAHCPGAEGGQGPIRGFAPGVEQAWATGSRCESQSDARAGGSQVCRRHHAQELSRAAP